MKVPAIKEMLAIWEKSSEKSLIEKTMNLLSALSDDNTDPAMLSIGERDARLFQVRKWMFGSELSNIADCPRCREHLEWANDVDELLLKDKKKDGMPVREMEANGYSIRYRLLNSYDILKIVSDKTYMSDPKKIYSDCILEIKRNGEYWDAEVLPGEVFDRLDEHLAEEDPQADITMLLKCPVCSNTWEISFDIMSYLWLEIDSWAKRILTEVTALASTFHWSESDILNMSPKRRRIYLELVSA